MSELKQVCKLIFIMSFIGLVVSTPVVILPIIMEYMGWI